jgi:S-adenosylmethionine decarboxylase proenzyme
MNASVSPPPSAALGQHSLFDLWECDPERISNRDALREALLGVIREHRGTIVEQVFHQFSPHGVTGVIVLAESHLAIHTWPEHGFAALDLFTCSATLDHAAIERSLGEALGARRIERRSEARGLPQKGLANEGAPSQPPPKAIPAPGA